MKQGSKNHVAGELHEAKGKVKEAAGHVTARVRKTQRKARQAAEKFDAPTAARRIRSVTAETIRRPAHMVARIGAWGKALLSSFLRMMERLFSYVGSGIRSISSVRLYKQRSLQAA